MKGVKVIRYLLANDAALSAKVSAGSIMAGNLPLATPLPAISVKFISGTPRNVVSEPQAPKFHVERIQVAPTTRGTDADPQGGGYPELEDLQALILTACAHRRGIIAGVNVDSILPDLEGPDISDDASSLYSRSRDFIVKYNA